ncbi:MAG: hypothetical protein E6F98_06760 [Actinobacteria bacterium]|nr:MAG: hypothetical protein E6F98_06760 [Actinomycetota bacterium]
MQGLMAPPKRHPSRPLMLAAGSPLRAPRGLMTAEAGLAAYDFHLEVTRLLWGAVAVLALALYLEHALAG